MAETVGIAVASALGTLFSSSAAAAWGYALGYAATYASGAYLLNKATEALTPKAPQGKGGGLELNYSGTDEPKKIIYGEVQVGGMQTIPPIATGNDGRHLHLVLTLAGHEVDSISAVNFDRDVISGAQIGAVTGTDADGVVGGGNKYADKAWIRRYYGTAAQTADYILTQAYPDAFDADFRGRGHAYLAVRLRFGEIYPGLPNITALVKGRKCYDPRTSTTVWTDNPAVIARDWLVTYGGYTFSATEEAACIAAANVCDQTVAIPTATTQKRYTCNLVLEAPTTPREFEDRLKSIVDTMRGRVVQRDGRWYLYAGAWDVPSIPVAKADWVGQFSMRASAEPEDRWNAVRVWYIDPERDWQRVECYPRRNTTYETDDGGDRIWLELELPGVTNEYEAQRHGEFALRASRNQLMVTGRLRPEFFTLATWDTVSVTDDEYGWVSKGFRVAAMDLTPMGECDVTLVEEGSALWTDLLESDYNAITTWPTIDPGASVPQERQNFVVTPQPAAIGFTWDKPTEPIPGEQTRLLEGVNNTLASAAEIWRGDSTGVIIHKTAGDQVTRYYWVQGIVGSYSGLYTPNSFGTGAAAAPWTNDAMVVQLSLPTVALPATVAGTVLDYSAAAGFVEVRMGGVNVTTYAAISATSQAGCVGAANSADDAPTAGYDKGYYRVTNVTSDIGMLWMTAVYSSATHLLPFVITKQKSGVNGIDGTNGGALMVPNGLMTEINSLTGRVSRWELSAAGYPAVYASTNSGINGAPCIVMPNTPTGVIVTHEDYIPVDLLLNNELDLKVMISGTVASGRYVYLGLACYDEEYQHIGYHREKYIGRIFISTAQNSSTKLYCYPPTLADSGHPGWDGTYDMLIGTYKAAGSKLWTDYFQPENKLWERRVTSLDYANNIAYLESPPPVDIGPSDYLAHGVLGGTHKYFSINPAYSPNSWTSIYHTFHGEAHAFKRLAQDDETDLLRYRTRYVRPFIQAEVGAGDFMIGQWVMALGKPRETDPYVLDGRIDSTAMWTLTDGENNTATMPITPGIVMQANSGASGGAALKFNATIDYGASGASAWPRYSVLPNQDIIKRWQNVTGIRFDVRFQLFRATGNTGGIILFYIANKYVMVDVSEYATNAWTSIQLFIEPTNIGPPFYCTPRLAVIQAWAVTGSYVLISDIFVNHNGANVITWQQSKTSTYTLTQNDVGRRISITTGGVSVSAALVSTEVGAWIEVYNNSASAQSIIASGITLRLAGTATTGTRTLAAYGLAILNKVATSEWVVHGAGVT